MALLLSHHSLSRSQFAVMLCDAGEPVGDNEAKISRAYYTVGHMSYAWLSPLSSHFFQQKYATLQGLTHRDTALLV